MEIKQSAASPHNYTRGRGGRAVKLMVIHVQDGTQRGSIAWFKNPASNVSAHYLIGMDGEVVQMVDEADTAWQAGDFGVNQTSIGIEHEGQPSKGRWLPSAAQLAASAALVADICQRHGITPSPDTIIPHSQINPAHRCPGPTWPWSEYLKAVAERLEQPLATAHQPSASDRRTVRLFDPQTNQPLGIGTLIAGTDKVYIVPAK